MLSPSNRSQAPGSYFTLRPAAAHTHNTDVFSPTQEAACVRSEMKCTGGGTFLLYRNKTLFPRLNKTKYLGVPTWWACSLICLHFNKQAHLSSLSNEHSLVCLIVL